MKHFTLNSFVKTVDNDITTVKLIESHNAIGSRSFTVELKQGLFITELQYGFNKIKALALYSALIDSRLDVYIDKYSVVDRACSVCSVKSTMLIQFDNGTYICEDCAVQHGVEL